MLMNMHNGSQASLW